LPIFPACPKNPIKPNKTKKPHWVGLFLKKTLVFLNPGLFDREFDDCVGKVGN